MTPAPTLLRSKPLRAATAVPAGALVGLVAWQLAPTSALLGHDPATGRSHLTLLGWFTVSWLLMAIATMPPTSLPLLAAFARLLGDRADAGRRIADMVLGYLAVLTATALVLAGGDVGIHTLVERAPVAGYGGLAVIIGLTRFAVLPHTWMHR